MKKIGPIKTLEEFRSNEARIHELEETLKPTHDEQLLEDFIAVNWATYSEPITKL